MEGEQRYFPGRADDVLPLQSKERKDLSIYPHSLLHSLPHSPRLGGLQTGARKLKNNGTTCEQKTVEQLQTEGQPLAIFWHTRFEQKPL